LALQLLATAEPSTFSPLKTRLLLAALATTASAFAIPPSVPEISSTLPLLAVGVVALGFLARRLRK
jgi:hypothetical protein